MTRTRRSVLAALAGGTTFVSGCGSSGDADTATRGRGTSTVSFTTSTATETPAGERSPSATGTATERETPDAVTRAIARSRGDLATALERLDAAEVVEDGRVGLVTENAFAEYARTPDPREPIREARERLDFVSDAASGRQQRAVNGLLFLCEYLETRAAQHDRIVDGFSSYYEANRAFPAELKLDVVSAAVGDLQRLGERVATAREVLGRIESRADALGVETFDFRRAHERQRTYRAIGREFAPAFAGTRSMLRAVGVASATGPAIERGEYAQAEGFATAVVTATRNGRESLATAFDREVRHFRDAFRQDRCLCSGLETVGERYAESARAYLDDRPERGREHYRAATDALAATENECGIEL